MVIMVKIPIITCISCRLERCCILCPQWLLFTTRQQTVKGIILVMQMILNGIFICTSFTCLYCYILLITAKEILLTIFLKNNLE